MSFGNEPVTVVELVQDYCDKVYGVTCNAVLGVTGDNKCFNTYRSCQDSSSFSKLSGGLTIRFAKPIQELPLDWQAIPSVRRVNIKPTVLNIGGAAAASGSLGERGTCTITFSDHPDGDIKTDPYLSDRSYDAFSSGTFWTKWLARNVYYKNWLVKIRQGYLSQDLADMKTSHFLIDKIDGPDSSGRVTLKGTDVLRLVDDDKVKVPDLSPGELNADITISDTTLDITGALTSDYDSVGSVRIGSEIMTYTSLSESGGIITLSGITRGAYGSEASAHSKEDQVQKCLIYDTQLPHDVAYDLLVNQGPVSSSYIDYTDWDSEASVWLPQFSVTTVISKPTGMKELLSSLTQECMFYIWWDERVQELKLRAVRPPEEQPVSWDINGHILQGSQSYKEDPKQRVSRVYVYYQPKNWADNLDDKDNFRKARLNIDSAAESDAEYGEKQSKEIFCRFIRTDAQVINLAARFIAKYRDTPKYLTLKVDADNRDTWTADIVDVTSDMFVNFIGENETRRFQVISAEEVQAGEIIQYDLQSSIFIGGKFAFYMASDAPTYTNATEVERREGAWYSDVDGLLPDGSDGYTYQ